MSRPAGSGYPNSQSGNRHPQMRKLQRIPSMKSLSATRPPVLRFSFGPDVFGRWVILTRCSSLRSTKGLDDVEYFCLQR